MNNPLLYLKANKIQRQDVRNLLNEYRDFFQWRPGGKDSLLDIGCACGDVTSDIILKVMPKNFSRLVGVDISEDMICYACENYKTPKVDFQVMDIAGEVKKDPMFTFDHITSFYCLHWVQNQKQAVQNIFNFLKPKGDCLIVFLINSIEFDWYKKIARTRKWSKYLTDVYSRMPPLKYETDPVGEFDRVLDSVGFAYRLVEERTKIFVHETRKHLKDFIIGVCPFNNQIPTSMRDDFFEDLVDLSVENSNNQNQYITEYSIIVAYAQKMNENRQF